MNEPGNPAQRVTIREPIARGTTVMAEGTGSRTGTVLLSANVDAAFRALGIAGGPG